MPMGKLITFEGGDGSGKTTMIKKLSAHLEDKKIPYLMTREPGGIDIAEKIRSIILNPEHTTMDARTEALLMQLLADNILRRKSFPHFKME